MITGSLSFPFPFSRPANFSRAFFFRSRLPPLSESLEQAKYDVNQKKKEIQT